MPDSNPYDCNSEAQNSEEPEASREISKQWIGVPHGCPAPGAYQVSRQAIGGISIREREDEPNDSGSDTEPNQIHSHDESHIMTVERTDGNDDQGHLPHKRNRRYFRLLFLTVLVVTIIVAVTIGLTMRGRGRGNPNQQQSPSNTMQKLHDGVDEEIQVYWFSAIVDACETNRSISDAIKLVPETAMEIAVVLMTDIPLFAAMKGSNYNNCTANTLAFWWLVTDANYYTLEQIMERYTLALLYIALGGKEWTKNQRWLSNHTICGWEGVTCHPDMDMVDALLLNDLVGTLPTELALLTSMKQLSVPTSNLLIGQLPSEIGLLSNLVQLQFSTTAMSGEIPSEIGLLTGLTSLQLSANTFTGMLPASIGTMTNLIELYLSHNVLEGAFPLEFWQLTKLELLDISFNSLRIPLATEIGLLTSLLQFAASASVLSGTIPSTIGMCTLLTFVDVSLNQLTGTIPLELANLTQIQQLQVQDNHLTGTILDAMCELSSLKSLITIGCTENTKNSLVCPIGCCTSVCNLI
jgi:Leucine rich repeat